MTGTTFFAVSPQGPILDDLAARSPSNPFATPRYFDARRRIGDAGWVVGLHDDRGVTDRACGAFLRGGRLNVGLTIPSLPLVGAESPFWPGLREFCRAKSVTEVELGTFGSAAGTEIPALRVPGSQRSRAEWVLLLDVDIDAGLGSNHARNVTKARKAGLSIGAVSAPEAAAAHHALMRQSLGRRQLRGESVGSDSASREIPALLES
ncbi:MAG: hypothetical protein ACRENN_07440, partial [Candidatus Eiseniibacteriota bacterium]